MTEIIQTRGNSMIKKLLEKITAATAIFAFVVSSYSVPVSAAQITDRSVTIGSSVASAETDYSFTFTVPTTGTAIQSVEFEACTTASGACTTPTGFNTGTPTLASQPTGLGAASGWTINTAAAGSLRITHLTNTTNPSGSQTVVFDNVINPSATNATYFFRTTTYSDAAWTTAIDTGTNATSTAGEATVTASVDETLTFTMAATTVPLGVLSTSSTGTGTSNMTAATNAQSGYAITVNGSTLQSTGGGTIDAITAGSGSASTTDSSQFGINLMSNSTPTVGTATSGSGSGAPQTGYDTADTFKYVTGDIVAAASNATNSNTYTVSYIANINGTTPAGSYTTILNYIATANF